MQDDMRGKVVMVTGATSGIGRVTALELARLGATVVLVGRSQARAEATAQEIQRATGNPAVDFLLADLSILTEVCRLADDFKRRHDRLDVLVNNAGAYFTTRQESAEGYEMTLALNHLSPFLLTHLLLDVLQASAPARIVTVSSDAHRQARIDFGDLQSRKGYRGFRAYSRSKLMNVLFTYELARRLAGTGVTANALHPGFVASNFGRNNGDLAGVGMAVVSRLFAISPEKGARTSIYLASSPEVEGVSGRYFVKKRAVRSSAASYDQAAAGRLWEASEALVGLRELALVGD
jgi:NAD(P)-dependent dehydrogenase (short-subunit alcohol dehydrogenase family)